VIIYARKFGEPPNEEIIYVTRDQVKGYINDPLFVYYLGVFQTVKLWGLPHGSAGWATEDACCMEAITALEMERREIENEQLNGGKEIPQTGGNAVDGLRKGA